MHAHLAADFLRALSDVLTRESRNEPRLLPFADQIATIKSNTVNYEFADPLDHPVMAWLAPALTASSGSPHLLGASHRIAKAIQWYQIFQGDGPKPAFADGLLGAQVAGNAGVFTSPDIRCGLFLVAPGLRYPSHTHAACEVYLCLSGELEITHGIDRDAFTLRPGDYSVTPSNTVHSLSTKARPALLVFVWIGEVDAPNWIWERDATGGWTRSQWVRQPNASWSKAATEPVSPEALRFASQA